ncbi:MAG: hypothetical protein D6748_14670 [Calditrichaeota bacterium]|nr:MAG: hypothetical protein D6748_14670 [Calditrichota bacterium]
MGDNMKNVFVAATRQNDGKTMVSLGLFNAFRKRYPALSYIKPVGQQYRLIDGEKIDKDAVLIHSTYQLPDRLSDMSPIAIPRGFTQNYIERGNRNELVEKVQKAYHTLADGKDFVLIEGTGHAGVGSVFDLCNADVAKLLGARVIIVSLGGIGRPIDEIMMNKALFDHRGVELLGVIINKVDPEKYDKINDLVRKGLKRFGIRVFGVVPLVQTLSKPSLAELLEDLDGELLSGEEKDLSTSIGKFVIGDMQPHAAVDVFTNNALIIVPGNRDGIIVTALYGRLFGSGATANVAGLIFTEGIRPHPKIMDLIHQSNVPVMLVKEDSFSVATKINRSIFKLRAEETEKIRLSQQLVEQYVDVDAICSLL